MSSALNGTKVTGVSPDSLGKADTKEVSKCSEVFKMKSEFYKMGWEDSEYGWNCDRIGMTAAQSDEYNQGYRDQVRSQVMQGVGFALLLGGAVIVAALLWIK